MWTAGGKTILNLQEKYTKYLLAFLARNYLSNSQSYNSCKFTSHSVSKLGQNTPMLRNPPKWIAGGKIILTLAADTILYWLSKFDENNF